jgi:hypothetical protein
LSENLRAAAALAGLSPEGRKQIEGLSKALAAHRELLNLPADLASQKYQSYSPQQQQTLTAFKDLPVDPQRGWLQSAGHYIKEAAAAPFKGAWWVLNETADVITRTYRTAAIANDQDVNWGTAWEIANDKGDRVFRPRAIDEAKAKYGTDRVEAAMLIASGIGWEQAMREATDAQKAILAEANQKQDNGLFEDALTEVQQAKYSPGRDFASALGLRGTGAYQWVSGLGDAAFRIGTDPFLFAGKVKKLYDVGKYSLAVIAGDGEKVTQIFAKQSVRDFWNTYGAKLGEFADAKKAGDAAKAATARTELKRLAPEFGDTVIDTFASKQVLIRNADDARNYFMNTADVEALIRGQAARMNPLMPKLNLARKSRIAMYTATDKVFNLNVIGPDFLKAAYVTDEGADDIVTGLIKNPEAIGAAARQARRGTATDRIPFRTFTQRVDKFNANWSKLPVARDGFIDLSTSEATEFIYRTARLALPRYQSKIIAEVFNSSDMGVRKEIYSGLWRTVAAARGVDKTQAGQSVLNKIMGTIEQYGATVALRKADNTVEQIATGVFNGKKMAIHDWQLSDLVAVPSIKDLDQIAARDGILGRIVGFSHSAWIEKATSYWSFLTLAGPRYAIRNATEDLMMHLAVGDTPWAIAKGKWISNTLRLAHEGSDVGLFTRVGTRTTASYYANASRQIREAKELSDVEKVDQLRGLLATAIGESKFARMLTVKEREFLQDQLLLTNILKPMDEVTEGGIMAYTGMDQMLKAASLTKEYGKIAPVVYREEAFVRGRGQRGFGTYNPGAGTAEKISWTVAIQRAANSDMDRVALLALDRGVDAAIYDVTRWLLDPKNAATVKKFRLTAEGVSAEEHARHIVFDTAALFTKADGSLNRELWAKVVKDGKVQTNLLSIDDLPVSQLDMPAMLTGPRYIPVAEADDVTSTVMLRGWKWLGDMNARYSREPIFYATLLRMRTQMEKSGFDVRYMNAIKANLMQDGATAASAEKMARTKLAELINERAVAYTLSYVDNPAIQTQVAFASRNFARFYRATEDFYRRLVRAVRYNPDLIAKAALTYDGISHSGWVQQDENGESYFLYPALAPAYKAVQGALAFMGIEPAFKTPLPVQFGGKLNMITPSMNPDSLVPTFSGPLAGLSVGVVTNLIGLADKDSADTVKKVFLGPYSANSTMLQALLPAHMNRAYAALNRDDRDSQYASAMRKAITYLEAAGYGPKTTIDPKTGLEVAPTAAELEDYQDKLKSVTSSILALRFVFGFVAPASPQLDYRSDMKDWMRDAKVTSWKNAWNQLLTAHDNDYEKAFEEWVRLYPKKVPYTVGENKAQVAAQIRPAQQAGYFLQQNKALFDKYPQGAAFLMPLDGEFTYESWRVLKNQGLYEPKAALGDFLREVQTSGDYAEYKSVKKDYEARLAATPFDWEKKQLKTQFEDWAKMFKAARPQLAERLASFSEIKPQKTAALNDLIALLDDKSVRVQPKTRAALRELVSLYNQYQSVGDSPLFSQTLVDMTKMGIEERMREVASRNPNVGAAYSTIFSYLMGVDA